METDKCCVNAAESNMIAAPSSPPPRRRAALLSSRKTRLPLPGRLVGPQPGFTLMELVICLVIALLMLTMATSSVVAVRHRMEARGSAYRYVAKHSLARGVAVRMGRTSRLQVDTVAKRMWVEVERSATRRDTVGVIEYLDNGVKFRSTRTVLCFDARGMAKSGGSCEAPDVMAIFSMVGRADTVRTSAIGRIIR
jgi:prepilin-type N-terminal cleavage/methylation domain-containing protein